MNRRIGMPAMLVALMFLAATACEKGRVEKPEIGARSAKKEKRAEKKDGSKSKKDWPKYEIYAPGELTDDRFRTPENIRSLVFAGDIMMADRLAPFVDEEGVDYPFRATQALLKSADLTIGNLETPIAVEAKKRRDKGFFYKTPPGTLEGLRQAGFDVVSLANNHVRDCDAGGVLETLKFVDEHGLGRFGAGKTLAEAKSPLVVDVKGLKIAFVGFNGAEVYLTDFRQFEKGLWDTRKARALADLQATDTLPGTLVAEENDVREMVRAAKAVADMVVVFPHWGIRYHRPVFEGQERFARAAIDEGADLVVGTHVHFWQATEVYKGKPIVYGIGNFAFGSHNPKADHGLVVRALVEGKSVKSVELYPTYTNNRAEQVRFQPKIMKGADAEKELAKLKADSAKRSAEITIENGVGYLRF
ncbi:MAG: CapA family protein [Deltaproteobacteria bacterium]|nr:CapA family protein [Deltaproteobacteria bacterium]